ncbi:hypothetical protein ACRALDRAFT_209200, partial [Sodiomyces alcalophilus JCM 7366]|uniref:uncharacterized protein n=1 Tax=Sodiomyces alcalophilus JCM 7366 TaxID=591952 RepID=UPI0039B4B0F1
IEACREVQVRSICGQDLAYARGRVTFQKWIEWTTNIIEYRYHHRLLFYLPYRRHYTQIHRK